MRVTERRRNRKRYKLLIGYVSGRLCFYETEKEIFNKILHFSLVSPFSSGKEIFTNLTRWCLCSYTKVSIPIEYLSH
jgi:hypothetical protein